MLLKAQLISTSRDGRRAQLVLKLKGISRTIHARLLDGSYVWGSLVLEPWQVQRSAAKREDQNG